MGDGGLADISLRNAKSITHTAMMHIAAEVRFATYQENNDVDTRRENVMIDLAEFEDMVTSRQEDEDGNISLDRGDILELIDMVRRGEKDAARYRFLLDNCTTQQADSHGPIFVMTIRQKNNPFNVGLSIDEAMNA